MKKQKQISISSYQADGFIKKYQKIVHNTVLPYQYDILWDKIAGIEKSHVIKNFINAAKVLRGEEVRDGFYGMVFQDSDAYKWLEAAAYVLATNSDKALEKQADELIDLIADAQDTDGYLNTYFTIKDADKRWSNLLEGHELYCSGHMIEAACAYYEATDKRKLLDVAIKNAECIYHRFITSQQKGIPGHPEIELALLRLYRLTKNQNFLTLSKYFIDERGQDPHIFEKEAKQRDWTVWGSDPMDNDYRQSNKPVRAQTDAIGHAVRAVYLYTAMADLASETQDKELLDACHRLWKSITQKRMYLTGGIGSTVIGEAFTVDYDLPSDTAYAETCASVGLMFFAEKMLENEIKGEYADIMERAFYNTVLAGIQLDGKRFFYVNPLEVNIGISQKACTQTHVLPLRPSWYACACCPPNVARLISSMGKYAYGEKDNTSYCHLFAAGKVTFANGIHLECTTNYPHDLSVTYIVNGTGTVAIRIPGWSKKYNILVDGQKIIATPVNGYCYIDVNGTTNITIHFDETPMFVRATNKVPRLAGMTALMRGPLVYCFEGTDNGCVKNLLIDKKETPSVYKTSNDELGDISRISVKAYRMNDCDTLYSTEEEKLSPCRAIAIPYYCWGNRIENDMAVWMNVIR